MSNRFCASCGHSNPYTSVRPTTCAKCLKPFEAAFATVVKPVVQAPVQYAPQPQQSARPATHRKFIGARGREVPDPFAGAYQEEPEVYGNGEDGYIDKDQILDAAQALASTISESDFVVNADSDGEHHGRLPRPTNLPQTAPTKIRRRKVR